MTVASHGRTGILLWALISAAPAGAMATPGVRKGPWIMDPHGDAVTVMVERDVPGPVRVEAMPIGAPDASTRAGETARGPIVATDDTAVTLHEIRLAGLAPGIRYRYEVTGPGIAPTGGTFGTPPDRAAPFRFVVYGDTRSHAGVHAAIVHAIANEAPDFVIHTGDMVADGRDDALWQQFFDIEADLLRDTVFIPVIGNHEIMRLNSTGVEHFRRYVHCAPDSPRPELDYTITYGNVRLVLANAYDDWASPAMRSWLEGELARARREGPHDFLIVAMHWGLCSCGPHGENRRLRSAGIDDLFRQYGVDLVLAGHDHFYERGDDHGLRYVVTGGGGAPLYTADTARPYTLAYSREHHFLRVDAEGDALTVAAIRTDGTVIDRCALRHTGWDCPPAPAALRPDAGASHIDAGSASTSTPGCSCRAVGSLPRGGAMVAALACAALRRRRRGIARERVAG